MAHTRTPHAHDGHEYKADYTARLTVKIMLVSNELPRLGDSSRALASRFNSMRLRRSFVEREDRNLVQKLSADRSEDR